MPGYSIDTQEVRGNYLKRQLKELMEPIRQFCRENDIQSAFIPFDDDKNPEFQVETGPLADEIRPVLTKYGSIYVRLKD